MKFDNRRLIEMYNCETVLSAAKLGPGIPAFKREAKPPATIVDREIAENLSTVLRSNNKPVVLVPGG